MAGFARSLRSGPLPLFCLLSVSLCGVAAAQNPSQGQKPATSDAESSFSSLKSLAGSWAGKVTTEPHNPDIEGPIQATMRVGSKGSVLVHEMAPGGMTEPTMIYLDRDSLTLVHYCEAGNRPRLVARKASDGKTVEFGFADVSGGTAPVCLNHLVFTIVDPNHHTEDWTFVMPGDKTLRAHFDLKRAKGNAPPKK